MSKIATRYLLLQWFLEEAGAVSLWVVGAAAMAD